MIHQTNFDGHQNGAIDPVRIQDAMWQGVRDALRRHMLLGESVAVAGPNGGVRTLGPEEIRKTLDAS